MELVVVNGASNISKSVIRSLTQSGKYNKVRLLDFRPYRQSVYSFQRELNANKITLDKRLTMNAQSLDIAMEGADQVVYFTHDYTSMTADKSNFLVATAKLAKKHGVKHTVAVCPVEHDLAYTEDLKRCWVDEREEMEHTAIDANKKLSLLHTDLVFGSDKTYLMHYLAQCVLARKIPGSFLSGAKFRPVHHDDLSTAVAHLLKTPLDSQHLQIRGSEEFSVKDLVNMVEKAAGHNVGDTKAMFNIPFLEPGTVIEEFFTGITHDRNMARLIDHFAEHDKEICAHGECFFQKSGLSPKHSVSNFFGNLQLADDCPSMVTPTFGAYKCASLD